MPVYLATAHAYRSWSEADPRGYVQRGEGLQPPDPTRARYRDDHATDPPRRFDAPQQGIIHDTLPGVTREKQMQLYAASVTRTHVHALIAFGSPACSCGASRYCRKGCAARECAQDFIVRMKRKAGSELTKHENAKLAREAPHVHAGLPPASAEKLRRKWFSRGWDLTPVRDTQHLRYLLTDYLPKHEREGGIVRIYTRIA